jgi:hypothetical protein
MNEPPFLTRHDIEQQLDALYRSERRRHLVALYGRGTEEMLSSGTAGLFRIVSVRSELELRERMPPLGEEARIAFLLPWPGPLALDLSGRFALGGRVLRVGREARLTRLFDATEVDAEARACSLSDYLLRPGNTERYPVAGGRLTVDAMWEAWLAKDWQIPAQGGLGLDALLGWAALDGRGAQFVESMALPEAHGVRDALLGHLRSKLGPAGPVVLGAWEQGAGQEVLELALLFETLADKPDAAVRIWVKGQVRQTFHVDDEKAALSLAQSLGVVGSSALRFVESRQNAATVRAVVKAANARVVDDEIRQALVDDHRVPCAFQERLARLGRVLARAAAEPSAALVAETKERLRHVEMHAIAREDEQLRVLKRADMAARLVAWLASQPTGWPEAGVTPFADVETLAPWYAAEGGYVDRARHWARGTFEGDFGKGVAAAVAAADARRVELDRRFARAVGCWVEAGRPASQVVPMDRALRRIAIEFLEQAPERRLLVLLVDGMAWAQAVELLESLSSRAAPWGPIAWHRAKEGRIGEGFYPAVLSNLPTNTDVSRSAFFAGKAMAPGKTHSTAADPDRWSDNADVRKLFPGTDRPRLLLRSESHTGDGSATEEALSLVAHRERRVVAIVINAIDASLKGDTQHRHSWTYESIASLPDLLDKAREHGRTVLLASDHGHVPGDCLKSKSSHAAGGARWRPWTKPDEPLAPFEVGIAGSGVWTPKQEHGLVLIADDQSCYGGTSNAGEHGGATLAEVVAPCVLIGCDESGGLDLGASALRVRPPHVPAWWHLEVSEPVSLVEAPGAKPEPRRPGLRSAKPPSELQMTLPTVEVSPLPTTAALLPALTASSKHPSGPPGRKSEPPASVAPLAGSEMFKARIKGDKAGAAHVLVAVAYLLDRNGLAHADAFATAMHVMPYRVAGFVATLSEVLNVDGYLVLAYDGAGKQVRLDREKLAQLFEVKL